MPVLTGAPVSSSSIVVSPKVVRPRSKSVPPRKSDSEKEADPLQSSLSYKRRIKILKERFQMHSPKTDAVQAVNRIVLDSATRKSVHVSQLGGPKPRPENASTSRHGGKERVTVATSPIKRKAGRRPRSAAASTKSAVRRFGSSNVSNRVRPRSALVSSHNRRRDYLHKSSGQSAQSRERPASSTSVSSSMSRTRMWDTNYAKKNRDRSESKASSVGSGVIEGIKSDIGLGEPSRFDEYPREGAYAPRELQRLFGEMEVISTAEFYETVAMLGETEIDDRQQKTGRTLMMMAVKKNQLQKFSMLLTCGASARCVSNDGSTALSLATSSMDTVQYIEPLLARGADVNAGAGLPAGTALHAAVRSRSLTLVCRVLEMKGVDVNAVDANGRTPLHIAFIIKGGMHVASALIQAKADRKAVDNDGLIPEEYQRDNDDE